MRSRRRHSKRTADQWPEEEQVDDLAVAASFAAQAPVATTSNNNIEVPSCDDVPNAAEASSEDEDDSSESDGVQTNTVETCTDDAKEPSANDTTTTTAGGDDKEQEEDEQSSDEESEVDLAKALARMHDDSDNDEEGRSQRASRKVASPQERGQPPKTENEVDPYHMPVKELESKFHLSLTVQERERLELVGSHDDMTNVGEAPDSVQLCPAGRIKYHMVSDRTIVVESNIMESAPLDEGSLLVIKVENDKQSAPDDTKDDETSFSRLRLVPLGKVFEVFGPVSRPLYTIRLPPPLEMPAKPPMQKKCPEDEKTNRPESDAQLTENSTSSEPEVKPKQIGADASEAKITVGESGDIGESSKQDEGKVDPSTEGTEAAEAEKDVDGTEVPAEDPWSPNGRSTQIVRSFPSMTVYYIQNEVKMIDTGAITRSSGRGCDASNLYDEEVVNVNEMEFSDDEQEREAKSRRKKKGGRKVNRSDSAKSTASSCANNAQRGRNRSGTTRNPGLHQGHSPGYPLSVASTYYQAPQHYYPGMTYHQPQMSGAHAQPYPYHQQPPTYYYQPTVPTAQPNAYQGHPGYPQMQSVAGVGGVPPPPPPPPRPYNSNAPVGFVSQGRGYPGQPTEPEQESDTVYYDYS